MARQSRIQSMTSNGGSLRILLADDHDVMRQGTRLLIERQPGWEVCGLASTGREAVAQADELNPNIVIMDMTMPEMNGLTAAIEIKRRVAESKSNKAIAEALGISDRTVEAHRASILRKLNLDSVAALVRYAIRRKLIAA